MDRWLREWLIFPRVLLGGVIAAIIMWIVIFSYYAWRIAVRNRAAGEVRLGAVAGGWTYLLHSSVVLLLLTIAFGVGLYIASRR